MPAVSSDKENLVPESKKNHRATGRRWFTCRNGWDTALSNSPCRNTGACNRSKGTIGSIPFPVSRQKILNKAENAISKAVGSVLSFPAGVNDSNGLAGAGDGDRTRDVQLGKLAFYR